MARLAGFLMVMSILVGCASVPRLHVAVQENDLAAAQELLEGGADANQLDSAGTSALHKVAWSSSPEMAELLIRHGANLEQTNMFGSTPLISACIRETPDVAKVLLAHGARTDVVDASGATPLSNAAVRGHRELAEALLERGAALEASKAGGPSPLSSASTGGHEEMVHMLLERGAIPDGKALFAAAGGGHLEIVQTLASRDADLNYKNLDGTTPLLIAAARGHADTAHWLRQQGGRMETIVHVFRWVSVPANVELILDCSEGAMHESQGDLQRALGWYESQFERCEQERAKCAEAASEARSDRTFSTMGVFLGPIGTESAFMNARARANATLGIQTRQLECLDLATRTLRARVDRCRARAGQTTTHVGAG